MAIERYWKVKAQLKLRLGSRKSDLSSKPEYSGKFLTNVPAGLDEMRLGTTG
jgi:hypothetical protein